MPGCRASGRRAPLALLAVLAVVLAGCGRAASGPAAAGAALTDAAETTLEGSFAFTARVEMDEAATATVAEAEPLLAALLPELELRGQRTGSGFAFELLASGQPLAEWREPQPEELYVRVRAAAIAQALDTPLNRSELLEPFEAAPDGAQEFYRTALDGGWVGVTGPAKEITPPLGQQIPDFDSEKIRAAQREHLGASVTESLERFTSTTEAPRGSGEGRRLEVAVRTRALAEGLAGLQHALYAEMLGEEQADAAAGMADLTGIPAAVSGVTVVVDDRRVQRITIEAFEMARQLVPDGGADPDGSLRLVVELAEHGSASVEVPDDAAMFTASDLGEAHPRRLLPMGLGMGWWRTLLFVAPSVASGGSSGAVESETRVETVVPAPMPTGSAVPVTPAPPPEQPDDS